MLPPELVPDDGRFGSGPSKVSLDALDSLAKTGSAYMGTSHRRDGVRSVVSAIKSGLIDLYNLPKDYEVVLGVGGATIFWDAAAYSLIRHRSQHLLFGEFSSKFAAVVTGANWLAKPEIVASEIGTHPLPIPSMDVDVYALTHNETSTGVSMPIQRAGTDDSLVLVDATSAAGAMTVNPHEFDIYYFSPQKAMGSDGGLWLALCSPSAIDRIDSITQAGRWIPPSLNLANALDNSRKNQTYNTPGLATLFLLRFQIDRLNANGGLTAAASHCEQNALFVYEWAQLSSYAEPFVSNPHQRSHTTVVVDLDPAVSANDVITVLAENGIIDLSGYRKLGRNQLRIGTWPSVTYKDIQRLTAAIDYVVERL